MSLWHYTVDWQNLSDGFLGSPRSGADTQCIVDNVLARLGAGGFSDMDRLAVGAFEGDGDAILPAKRTAYSLPAQMDPGGLELEANRVYQMVGKHGDEQMSAYPIGLAMVDGAQSELGFEAAKDRLQVRKHGVGPPQGRLVPRVLVGAQAVDPG